MSGFNSEVQAIRDALDTGLPAKIRILKPELHTSGLNEVPGSSPAPVLWTRLLLKHCLQ